MKAWEEFIETLGNPQFEEKRFQAYKARLQNERLNTFVDAVKEDLKSDETYYIGDCFRSNRRQYYILAVSDGHKVILVRLIDGHRWSEPFYVSNNKRIANNEFLEGLTKVPRQEAFKDMIELEQKSTNELETVIT